MTNGMRGIGPSRASSSGSARGEALEAVVVERGRLLEEHIIESVREFGIEEHHSYWGSRPLEERRRLIRAAQAV